MEVVRRMISETKKLAADEEELRAEVSQLNCELMVEEFNVNIVKKDSEIMRVQVHSTQEALNTAREQIEFIKTIRATLRTSIMLNSLLRKYIEKADPTTPGQEAKFKELESKYQEHLKKYEESPTYQAMLLEEATERDLRKLVSEKHNETMRLETQREF